MPDRSKVIRCNELPEDYLDGAVEGIAEKVRWTYRKIWNQTKLIDQPGSFIYGEGKVIEKPLVLFDFTHG